MTRNTWKAIGLAAGLAVVLGLIVVGSLWKLGIIGTTAENKAGEKPTEVKKDATPTTGPNIVDIDGKKYIYHSGSERLEPIAKIDAAATKPSVIEAPTESTDLLTDSKKLNKFFFSPEYVVVFCFMLGLMFIFKGHGPTKNVLLITLLIMLVGWVYAGYSHVRSTNWPDQSTDEVVTSEDRKVVHPASPTVPSVQDCKKFGDYTFTVSSTTPLKVLLPVEGDWVIQSTNGQLDMWNSADHSIHEVLPVSPQSFKLDWRGTRIIDLQSRENRPVVVSMHIGPYTGTLNVPKGTDDTKKTEPNVDPGKEAIKTLPSIKL